MMGGRVQEAEDTPNLKTKSAATKPHPNQPLQWTMECQRAFETLKALFIQEPILRHPDPN